MRLHKILLLVSLMSALILSSCGSSGAGITPASTIKPSDGSPVVKPTHTPTSSPVTSYAFVRQSQLWVSLNGRNPVQVTHFDYRSAGLNPNIFFGQPLWFANDRFVAFTLKALPAGLGGGGCGFDGDYGRSGELFVLDTTSMQLAQISVPGEQSTVSPSVSYNGYWEYLFSEDATHLLAWHADMGLKGAGGLYRYDLNARTLTLIIPSSSVPGADNHEAWYPMRYSSGQLYYETMTPAVGNNTTFTIYSHSISNPGMPSTKVLDVGSEPFCASQGNNPNSPPVSGPFIEPGWDVSLDGKYLAAQTMVTNGSTTTGSVKVVMLPAGTTLTLFAQAPTQVLNHDASLSWSQDGQTVILKAPISTSPQITLYGVTLSSPTTMQTYNTNGTLCNADNHVVHLVWQGDGGVFAVFSLQQFEVGSDLSCVANVYKFRVGQPDGTLLLANALNFAWG